jgi:hypothetical protein
VKYIRCLKGHVARRVLHLLCHPATDPVSASNLALALT